MGISVVHACESSAYDHDYILDCESPECRVGAIMYAARTGDVEYIVDSAKVRVPCLHGVDTDLPNSTKQALDRKKEI